MPSESKRENTSRSGSGPSGKLRRVWRFLAGPAKVPKGLLLLAILAAAFAVYRGVEAKRARDRLEQEIQTRRKMTANLERMIRFQDVLLRGFKEHAAQNGYAPERLQDSLRDASGASGRTGRRQARGESPLGASRGRTARPNDGPAQRTPRRSGGGSTPRRERR